MVEKIGYIVLRKGSSSAEAYARGILGPAAEFFDFVPAAQRIGQGPSLELSPADAALPLHPLDEPLPPQVGTDDPFPNDLDL